MGGKKIFISYSRRDIDYVKSLVEALRSQGFEVWFDKNIMTGNDWDDTIEEEIKKADALVLILSKTSVASDAVKDEISYALSLGKGLNPIKIEECDVPMRLARKQYIDFAVLGHDLGFERLVNDLKIQVSTEKKPMNIPKGTFVPPQFQKPQHFSAPKPKPNNSLMIVLGILVGGGAVVFLIIFIVALAMQSKYDEPEINNPQNQENYVDYTGGDQTLSVEDQDWNSTINTNTLDGYLAFLYTYGRTTKYYEQAYTTINGMLPNTATVWYGVHGGNFNFSKYLYYTGDQTTPPQYDDIITPIFKSELLEGDNFVRNGNYVLPGQRLLVYDAWVDDQNNIWAKVRYN